MLYALLALMAPLWSNTEDSSAGQRETGGSASRFLLFTAITLFLFLCILWADIHRDDLHALGLVGTAQTIDTIFLSP